MRHRLPVLALFLTACAPHVAPAPVVELPTSGSEIAAAELRRDLFAFAADSMHGRETGTPDALRAAQFLADRVQRLGLEPAGDSLYLQRVPLQRETLGPSTSIVVWDGGERKPLSLGSDVVPLLNLGANVPPPRRSARADIVFVGYASPAMKGRRDDLDDVDMRGKVVVVLNGAPAGVTDSATRAAQEGQAAISERLARILPAGPSAVVVLFTGAGALQYVDLAPELLKSVTPRNTMSDMPDVERVLPLIMLGVAKPGSPLLPAGWPRDDRPQVLGRRLEAKVEQVSSPFTAYNVAAVVRGTDPWLRQTYVAFGAHYDHIGIVPPVNGDSIANGADDDGSGTVSLLAIARSMQQAAVKPKRSVLFVWHVGEEKGLLGSSWFTDHPTVPIDSIVAQLNADMIGRNAPPLLYTVGPVAAPNHQSRRLGAIVDSVNAREPVPFAIDRSYDSPTHPEHIYERSDHYSYARKGIPIVFFTTGMHADYHAPSDEPEKIDYEKMARVAKLMRDVGLAVAEGGKRPR